MYYKVIETGQEITRYGLTNAYPHVSFADVPDQEILDFLGLELMPDPVYPEPEGGQAAFDLARAKTRKNEEINASRLAANFTTFEHGGKLIACDQLSRSDIDGTNGFVALYGALPPGWPGGWKAVDNTYSPISTVAAWKAFYGSLFAAGNINFFKAQQLKTQLSSASTLEAVAVIVW